jgi:ribosomal protein L29
MESNNSTVKEQKKLSYEELDNLAKQLSQVNLQLRQKLAESDYSNFHQRMAYLFEIVRNADKFAPVFVAKCIKEIEEAITIPEVVTES